MTSIDPVQHTISEVRKIVAFNEEFRSLYPPHTERGGLRFASPEFKEMQQMNESLLSYMLEHFPAPTAADVEGIQRIKDGTTIGKMYSADDLAEYTGALFPVAVLKYMLSMPRRCIMDSKSIASFAEFGIRC